MELAVRPWFSFLELWRLPFLGRLFGTEAWLTLAFALGWLILIAAGVWVLARARPATPPGSVGAELQDPSRARPSHPTLSPSDSRDLASH